MEATLIEPEATEAEESIAVPGPEEFIACTSCGHRSYMHFFFMGDLLSFCAHHGDKSFEKLTDLEAPLLADYRSTLTSD